MMYKLITKMVFESTPGDEITLKDVEFFINLEELESTPRPPTLFLRLAVVDILHKCTQHTQQAVISCFEVQTLRDHKQSIKGDLEALLSCL